METRERKHRGRKMKYLIHHTPFSFYTISYLIRESF